MLSLQYKVYTTRTYKTLHHAIYVMLSRSHHHLDALQITVFNILTLIRNIQHNKN